MKLWSIVAKSTDIGKRYIDFATSSKASYMQDSFVMIQLMYYAHGLYIQLSVCRHCFSGPLHQLLLLVKALALTEPPAECIYQEFIAINS